MFCGKCGKKIADGAKFCPYCGGATGAAKDQGWNPAPSSDPIMDALNTPTVIPAAEAGPASPVGNAPILGTGKKRRGFGLLAAIGGVAVAAIVLVVVLFSGLLGGPKATLGKAVVKSVNACQAASNAVGLPDLQAMAKDKKVSQEMSVRLKSISDDLGYYYADLSDLEGLEVSVSEGVNLPDRKMDMSFALSYGSRDVLSAWVNIDNETVTMGCPEFLDSDVYGFNTKNLGKDLSKISDDIPEELEDVSFNIFDIAEAFAKPVEVDKAATKALTDAIEVEKTGKSTVEVNGHNVDCTGYHVVIPKDAMREYIGALEDAYKERGLDDAVIDALRSFGMSNSDLADIRSELKDALSGKEMFSALKQAVKAIGDLELDVFVNGGYVMAVQWEDKIEGVKVELGAYFGGGKNYADDWSMEVRADDVRVSVVSTGNHSADGGEFTDETSVSIRGDGESVKVTSEMSYQPKKSADNFEWTVKSTGFSLKMEGQLTASKNSMELELDKLAVNAMGTDLVSLSGSYAIKPYAAPSYSSKKATMLADMDEDDLEDLYWDVGNNVQSWAMDLINDIPALYWLF